MVFMAKPIYTVSVKKNDYKYNINILLFRFINLK